MSRTAPRIVPVDGRLCERIRVACADALAGLPDGPARSAVAAVADRLGEQTVRIAVGGRLNAGKSTLVNALLGQRLAATGATETTVLVTWFRYHHQNRVELRLKDGRSLHVPAAPRGGLPAALPVPVGDIASAVVEVANDRLAARYNVVDTPGLDSLSGLDEVALAALGDADALLYVMPHPGDRDREVLASLRATSARVGLTAANVVGVLSRIDALGDGADDPWPAARRVARRYANELRGLVADVIPVIGLLAETAAGDVFTEGDLRLLRKVAAVGPAVLADALYSSAAFAAWHTGPLDAADRDRLLRLLDVYGLRECLSLLRSGPVDTAGLLARITELSGVQALVGYLDEHFVRSADRLRAASAIPALERATWLGHDGDATATLITLRGVLNELRRDPVMRQVALAPALTDLAEGRITLPEELAQVLVSLATGSDDAARLGLAPDAGKPAVRRAADEWIGHWRRLEGGPSRLLARHARAARELCETAFFAAGGG
jgi:hypothetical protein